MAATAEVVHLKAFGQLTNQKPQEARMGTTHKRSENRAALISELCACGKQNQ